MIALLDLDLISYPVSAAAEGCTTDIAIARCDKAMDDLLYMAGADSYYGYLTGSNNFRKKINPDYKANRKDKPLPEHLNLLREHLVTNWNAIVTDGIEADDAIGIASTANPDAIICSYDKDLDQLTGQHLNWMKGIKYEITYTQGIRHFYKQLLIGDRADNIIGVDGIGKVKAAKLLDHLDVESDMLDCVKGRYDSMERLAMNGACLWILREENKPWVLT